MTTKLLVGVWPEPDPTITDDNWKDLETAAGLPLSPAHRANIRTVIVQYHDDITQYRQSPRASALRPPLDEIAAKATELAALLARPSPEKKISRAVRQALVREAVSSRHEFPDLKKTEGLIRQLAADAAAASAACGDDL